MGDHLKKMHENLTSNCILGQLFKLWLFKGTLKIILAAFRNDSNNFLLQSDDYWICQFGKIIQLIKMMYEIMKLLGNMIGVPICMDQDTISIYFYL